MGQINFQPVTQVTGPYGGTGYYGGVAGMNQDGTIAGKAVAFTGAAANGAQVSGAGGGITTPSGSAAGGQICAASADGTQLAGAGGGIVDNPYMTAGAGWVAADTNKCSLNASGAFGYEKASGELDASGAANWTNKSTGETHNASAMADITKGQGGTITVNKDGLAQTFTVPPRPTA
jgi:hypothetical protein